MDKFWAWMRDKGYNVLYAGGCSLIELSNKEIPKQMLAGYMLEYLIQKGTIFYFDKILFHKDRKIMDVYNYLKRIIENEKRN